ncbi:UNVERIFIED_CONTAM: membrane protein [Mumia flava]
MPFLALLGLAALAFPRVVVHDLDLAPPQGVLTVLLAVLPPVIWVVVVLAARVPNPFLTVLVIGALYGVLLAVGHQLFWDSVWGDDPPRLGGNLSDVSDSTHAIVTRAAAFVSSLFTGVLVGAVVGLVAWGLSRVRGSRRERSE